MTDPVFWALHYADGSEAVEPVENASIRLTRPGANAIAVRTSGGHELTRIDIPPGFKPVWYRKRGTVLDGSGVRLIATVFGYANEGGAQLFCWNNGFDVCPPEFIDRGMLALQAG